MTPAVRLPDGFAVRLHDDVVQGPVMRRGVRVLRLSSAARALLTGRELAVSSLTSAVLAGRLLDLDLAVPLVPERFAGSLDDLTVVVPVRDRADGVDRLLAQLDGRVACVVVDDASHDARRLADVVRRHGAELRRLERNLGPSGARNEGLRSIRTPFVAFVDSDVSVSAGDLERLLAHFGDPGLAAVAPRVRTRGGRRWFERYEDASGALDLGPTPATVRPWSPVAYVPSACLVARSSTIDDGFDVGLRSGEDVDLVWRLLDAGWRVRHAPEVDAWHEGRTTVGSWLGRKTFYGSSAAGLARRHGARVAPAVLTVPSAALVVAVALQRRWSWAAAAVLLGRIRRQVSADLPDVDSTTRTRVAASGLAVTARQASDLALRHWWPVSLVLAVTSRRARRLLALTAVADTGAAYVKADTTLDPVRFGAARRLDDAAYGAGVWWGAARDRSIRCLLPHRWPRGGARS